TTSVSGHCFLIWGNRSSPSASGNLISRSTISGCGSANVFLSVAPLSASVTSYVPRRTVTRSCRTSAASSTTSMVPFIVLICDAAAGLCERPKDRPVFRVPIRQSFRVKLHGQQEWQQVGGFRLQFHAFHNSILAPRGHLQWPSNPPNSLMMHAVHAQRPLAGYLGQ